MKKHSFALAALVFAGGFWSAAPAYAANGYVIIIAQGLSPQIVQTGKAYLQKAGEDADLTTSFEEAMQTGKTAPVDAGSLGEMKGLLETAEKNGFKTGLVTTGDLTKIAPLFYDLGENPGAALLAKDAKYDYLAGGGRANLAGAETALKDAGGTFVGKSEDLDGELKGRLLIAETAGDLNYNLDHDPETESGLGELASLAIDTLGADDKPFVLVVHDTLIERALQTKDTPALFEQFREVNGILSDMLARREDNPNLKIAALLTGGEIAPQFQAGADQNRAFSIISNLGRSYAGVGSALKVVDADALAEFLDENDGQYREWKLSNADKTAILNGKLDPETAVRAQYEPSLKLDFAAQTSAPVSYTLGFSAPAGLMNALKAAVSK